MSQQKQAAGEGAVAIQAEGDVSVHFGASKDELTLLLSDFKSTLLAFHADGQKKADDRLRQFRDEVLEKFEKSKVADPKAFSNLDFQYALGKAQSNYVRSEDDQVSESLVNLLTERSRYSGRSRTSLALNNAIETVGSLTREEIAVLTAIFIAKRTVVTPGVERAIVNHMSGHLIPLLGDLPSTGSSLDYLTSLGCATLIPFGQASFWHTFRESYAAAFAEGLTLQQIQERIVGFDPQAHSWLVRRKDGPLNFVPDAPQKWVLAAPNKETAERLLRQHDQLQLLESVKNFVDTEAPAEAELTQRIVGQVPALAKFSDAWDRLHLGSYNLTALGLTIADSNAKRLWASFSAPLTTWVS